MRTATADPDALLAGLEADTSAAVAEAPPAGGAVAEAPPAGGAAAEDDLDQLLASLNAEPPPAAPDAIETDLDALLASLK